MKLFENFIYQPLERHDGGPQGRLYVAPNGERLPSVTTILDATKSEESRAGLAAWRKRVGEQRAKQITEEAAGRGRGARGLRDRSLGDAGQPALQSERQADGRDDPGRLGQGRGEGEDRHL